MFSRLVARLQDKGHNAKVANKCYENAAKVEMFGEYSNKSELHPRGTRGDSVRLDSSRTFRSPVHGAKKLKYMLL
jgi:hypothetical protein